MTNEDVLTLIGRYVVDLEASRLRIIELEAELGRKTKKPKSNVVTMRPAAAPEPQPDGAPAPAEASPPPKETVEADPVLGQ